MSNSIGRMDTIAIIGAGEMGAGVGRRLRESGARVITTLKGRGPASVERANRAGLETIDDDDRLVREAAFILSIVPPGEAGNVAERYREPLGRAPEKPLFAECNAVSPATVRAIEQSLAVTACRFVDAGIIGLPPPTGRPDGGPHIYASGAHADLLLRLRDFGLDVTVVDGPVGAASALKLGHAGIVKGLIALGAVMAGAAPRDGYAAALRDELTRSQPQLMAWLRPTIPHMYPKSYRWVAEMEEIAEFVGADEDGAGLYRAAATFFRHVAAQYGNSGGNRAIFEQLAPFLAPPDSPKR
jgi:3-hydroxyisobutyrate dehydrogenase-like beta-hydroxyacid dehydrogenase